MPATRNLRLVFSACAALGVFSQLDAASACLTAACQPPLQLPAETFMPGNLVYFEVTAEAPGSITLRTEAGEPIPASIRMIGGARVFAPEAPIPPETAVILEYELYCQPGYDNDRPPGTFEFRTTEFSAIVLQPARLFVQEYGVAYPGVQGNERAFVRLGMDTPDPSYSIPHLLTHTATVDGVSIGSWPMIGNITQLEVGSRCLPQSAEVGTDSCGSLVAVPVGRHTVSVQTRVVGYEGVIPPVTIEIETKCPADGDAPVPTEPDAPSEPQQDPAPPPAGVDDEAVPETGNVSSDLDGASCAVASGTVTPKSFAASLLALGIVAWRRRARRG
jgi:hypothetical protein